jgi:uncharacterized repeat protein (TIGR03803 family)
VLYSFCSQPSCSDGGAPSAGLIADEHGALYSTTRSGGISNNGTVFKLTPPPKGQTGWTETVLYSFCSQPSCSDGAFPFAGLIADEQGAFYGTTAGGGVGNNGTVFKLTPPPKGQTGWTETVLYSFCSQPSCSDGAGPYAGLIADEQRELYGTTSGGGSSGGYGTVFKLTPPPKGQTAWTETVLHSFARGSDGGGPYAGLIADKQGAALRHNNGRWDWQQRDSVQADAAPQGPDGLDTGRALQLLLAAKLQRRRLPLCWPDRRRAGRALQHNGFRWDWQQRDGVQADAAPQGPDGLDRDRAL